MDRKTLNELNTLVSELDRKISMIKDLNEANLISINTNDVELLTIGRKSPMRSLIINAFTERVEQIKSDILKLDPEFKFD